MASYSRVIDMDVCRNGTDEPHQLLIRGDPDTTVPMGQPTWWTQRPYSERDQKISKSSYFKLAEERMYYIKGLVHVNIFNSLITYGQTESVDIFMLLPLSICLHKPHLK